jgi:hypothetical protein
VILRDKPIRPAAAAEHEAKKQAIFAAEKALRAFGEGWEGFLTPFLPPPPDPPRKRRVRRS